MQKQQKIMWFLIQDFFFRIKILLKLKKEIKFCQKILEINRVRGMVNLKNVPFIFNFVKCQRIHFSNNI